MPSADATMDGGSPARRASSSLATSKIAYLCVKPTTADDLKSKDELKTALQHAGHNPTDAMLKKYWGKLKKMTFESFHHILEQDPPPDKADLMASFKKLDPSGNGSVSHEDFIVAMTTRGEPLPTSMIETLLSEPQFNEDGKFNYDVFCNVVFETSQEMLRLAREKVELLEQNMEQNSKTYTVKKKTSMASVGRSASDDFSDRLSWHECRSKGAFYFEGESIICHQYSLKVLKKTKIDISIQPQPSQSSPYPTDCQLFIFKLTEPGHRNPDMRFQVIGRSPLVIAQHSPEEMPSWQGIFDEGSYLLVPATTGCRLTKRKKQPTSDIQLVSSEPGNVQLTSQFKRVLTDVYSQIDLDDNGSLSRQEFNLFNWRTSGEEVQDDEWKVLEENFSLTDHELTLDGFLQLHQMEAEDNGGDCAELWVTLNSMGYNHELTQDEASLFTVSVRSELEKACVLRVSGLKSGGSLLDKAVIRCIMDGCTRPRPIDPKSEVIVFREDSGPCTSFVIQNKSPGTASLSFDFSESKNVIINHPHLAFTTTLTCRSTLFVAHLLPKNPSVPHQVNQKEALISLK